MIAKSDTRRYRERRVLVLGSAAAVKGCLLEDPRSHVHGVTVLDEIGDELIHCGEFTTLRVENANDFLDTTPLPEA